MVPFVLGTVHCRMYPLHNDKIGDTGRVCWLSSNGNIGSLEQIVCVREREMERTGTIIIQ